MESAEAALVLPETFDLNKPCRLLVISVPSGSSSISAMSAYTNVALSEGWAVLAVDGPPTSVEEDTIQLGWAMFSSGLDHLARAWPQVRQWTMVCADFSGGAKRSGSIAAANANQLLFIIAWVRISVECQNRALERVRIAPNESCLYVLCM